MPKFGKHTISWSSLLVFMLKLHVGFSAMGVLLFTSLSLVLSQPDGLSLGVPFMTILGLLPIGIGLAILDVGMTLWFIASLGSRSITGSSSANHSQKEDMIPTRKKSWYNDTELLLLIGLLPIIGLFGILAVAGYSWALGQLEGYGVFLVVGLIVDIPLLIIVGLIQLVAWLYRRANKKPLIPGKKQRSIAPPIFATILVVVLVSPIIYAVYQKIQASREAEYFASLRLDMNNLKDRLEKLDTGWRYSESCRTSGQVFSIKASSCGNGITNAPIMNKNPNALAEKYIDVISDSNKFKQTTALEQAFFNKGGLEEQMYIEARFERETRDEGYCHFSLTKKHVHADSLSVSFSCSADAHEFHYPKYEYKPGPID